MHFPDQAVVFLLKGMNAEILPVYRIRWQDLVGFAAGENMQRVSREGIGPPAALFLRSRRRL